MRAIIFDYFGVLAKKYGVVNEELMDLIRQELMGKYKLAVLSNMGAGNYSDMLGANFDLFDEVLLSGNLGVAKPDERAFLLAARAVGEFPSDCLLVDDSATNCEAARSVGMAAIYYDNFEDFQQKLADYAIITP